MRKLFIKITIAFNILVFALILPYQAAKAETLVERLNNLTGPKKQYNTALSPAYLRNNNTEESISVQSGDLTLNQTDYVLPGKNGLDVEITRLYKSGTSNIQEMKVQYVDGAWVDYVYSDVNTSSFYEDRYNLGIGMRFSFPSMEIKKNNDGSSHKYLHTESGDVYSLIDPQPIDGIEAYVPETQTIKDVAVNVSYDFSNGQDDGKSRYVMVGKNGKKTYFSDDGRVLGIVDRYGNTIKFEYTALNYRVDYVTKNKKLISKITDTIGRVITIEYKEDSAFSVGPIDNTVFNAEESYKQSQNPNTMYSGDLAGKFQVIVHLPGGKSITYDKTAASVSSSKHVLRTRLQRVFDMDGKPKYHYWYEQPSLGFSFTNKSGYSAYNTYENLVQINYCRSNKIKRYTYNTFTKGLSEGSMQYRKIFEKKELSKKGYDTAKGDFLERFVCDVIDRTNYNYTNESDGFNFAGYQENNKAYLKDTYRYYASKTDFSGMITKYTYNGNHELLETVETGSDHKKTTLTENDEMKFPKKVTVTLYNMSNGHVVGQPSVKIENFRYDQYGNLTNYTGPIAVRDANGYPVDNERMVVYSYAYDKFHTLSQKSWKQDKDTACQIINTIDDKGNIIKEQKVNTPDTEKWINTEYQYDISGNMTQKKVYSTENTYTTNYEYGIDADGVDTKGAYLTREYSVVSGAELAKKHVYDMNTGNIKADIDGNDNRTSYEYDILERNTKITYTNKTYKQYTYKDYSNTNREVEYQDQSGYKYLFEYDIFDNVVKYSLFDNNQWNTLSKMAFDFRGNKIQESDSNGNKITYTYDSDNRLTCKSFYEKDLVKKESITLSYTLGISADIPLLLTLTDEDGYTEKYYYDAAEQLIKLEDTPDKVNYFKKTYTYNYTGNVTGETDALNATTVYNYDNLGRLSKKTDALKNETSYRYSSIDKLLAEEAPGGKLVSRIYDASGREIEERTCTKGSQDYYYKKYDYDKAGNVTGYSEGKLEGGNDSISAMSSYTINAMNRVTDEYKNIDAARKAHTHYSYDANGNKTEQVEYADQAENKYLKYTYSYDFAGHLTREDGTMTDGSSLGTGSSLGHYLKKYSRDYEGNLLKEEEFDGKGYQTTLNTYDYRNRLIKKVEPFTSDGKTKQTSFTCDARGNITAETVTRQGTACTTSYRYDGRGKLLEKIDAMKNITRYAYNENGVLKKESDPRYYGTGIENAPGKEYVYDPLGRLVKTVWFDGANRSVVSYKEYDGRGNVTKDADGEGYNSAEPKLSAGKVYEYDAADMVVKYSSAQTAKDSSGDGNSFTRKFAYDGSKRIITELDSKGQKTVRTYYLNGLQKEIIYPDNKKEAFEYDNTGKMLEIKKDRRDNKTTSYKNVFGKPYRVEYPDNTFETFEYTADGLMKESRDKKGNTTLFEYSPDGNLTAKREFVRSDSDNNYYKLTKLAYDETGLLLSSETFSLKTSKTTGQDMAAESAGDKVQNEYDNSGRLLRTYGPYGRESINAYDAAGNVIATKQKISDNVYKVKRFEYDVCSRKLKEALLVDTSEFDKRQLQGAEFDDEYPALVKSTTSYTYYSNDLVKSVKDANGNETAFEYNLDGKPAKKLQPLNVATSYKYDTEGNLVCETNGRGVSTHYDYDSMNRMVRKKIPAPSGGTAVTLYIYDAMGNLFKTVLPNDYDTAKDTPELASSMDGMSYTYDAMNRQTAVIEPSGKVIQYIAYDANGNVAKKVDGLRYNGSMETSAGTTYIYDGLDRNIQTTDALNGIATTEYDILGNVTKKTDTLKHSTCYEYNPDGTVARVVYPDNGSIVYAYDRLGRMSSQKNQRGYVTEYAYNAFDKVKSEKDPYQNSIVHKYDLAGNECIITDKRGSTSYMRYDALNRPTEKKIPLELDEVGNIVYSIECYTYDEVGNLLTKIQTGTKDTLSKRETVYTYYDNNQIGTQSGNDGSSTEYFYDNNGNLTKKKILQDMVDGAARYGIEKYSYDGMNRMTESIRLVDAEDVYKASGILNIEELKDSEYAGKIRLVTGYAYDILGNKLSEISPAGYGFKPDDIASRDRYTVWYAYDALNRLEKVMRKHEGGDVSVVNTYDAAGNIKEIKNERGYATKYTYDPMNRLKTQTDAKGNTIAYDYDAAGNRTGITNAKGHKMTYSYDMLNREENITDAYDTIISRKLYDANGNVIKTMEAKGYLSAVADNKRYGTVYAYDLANRLVSIAKPEAVAKGTKTETYEYNQYGNRTKVTNALGNTTSYEYDNGGRLTKVTDAIGIATTFGYDRIGNKLYMVNGRGKTTTYAYNDLGKIRGMTDAEGLSSTYQYDLAGNPACIVDRNGVSTVYTYDSRNMLIEKKVESAENCLIRYAYDEAGNRTGMTDESGTYTYSYDALNKLEKVLKGGTLQIGYTYDVIGNIESVTDRLGFTVNYTYDKSSRMETVSYAGNTVTYAYDKNGNRESITYASGTNEKYQYDKENKLLKLVNSKADGSAISTFSYTYDLTGKQLTKQDSYGISSYTYDADGRILKEVTPRKTAVYSYDKAGNRASLNETYTEEQSTGFIDTATEKDIKYILKKAEYVYSASDRLMKLVEKHCSAQGNVLLTKTTVYIYDKNGNQLRQSTSYTSNSSIKARQTLKGSSYGDSLSGAIDPLISRTSSTFDGFNRLKETEQIQDGVRLLVEYTYNGDDLRVAKTVKKSDNAYTPEETYYLYDRQHVVLETNKTGSLKTRYVRGINYLARSASQGQFSTILYNGHGDVVQTTDDAGTVQNSYDYDIWGNTILEKEQYSCSIRYAGEFFDKETGLYYLRARYYDPEIGRFISEDSYLGEEDNPFSLNLYTYCQNDPIIYTDPDGHFLHLIVGAVVGAVVNGGIEAGKQLLSGKKLNELNWKKIGGAAASGAITGLAAAATGGASLAATMAVGAAASMAGNAVEQTIVKGKIDNKEVLKEGVIGGLTFGAFHGVSSAVTNSSARNVMMNATRGAEKVVAKDVTSKAANVVKEVAPNSAGNVKSKSSVKLNLQLMATNKSTKGTGKPVEVKISQSKYPETAKHIEDAQKAGHPSTLTIDRAGTAANRKESLAGISKVKGKDLDEYPPAMFKEGGKGASVKPISPKDNRGAGASIGNQLRKQPNGTQVKIVVKKK